MKYTSLTVLLPSHSVEDLPLELPEQQAEGLLNAFAVLWHPLLLDSAGVLPDWERADEPPEELPDRLFLIPEVSQDWLPCQWADHARDQGAILVTGIAERAEMIQQVLEPLDSESTVDSEVVGDFLALGHCHLQLELLTRQMRYFSELDQSRLQTEAVSAARAALAGDEGAVRSHLQICFEMLLEGRERFYPVDCYLADLCLLSAEMAGDGWADLTRSDRIVNYLATAKDVAAIAGEHPEAFAAFVSQWRNDRQELIGGEWEERCNALLPLESVLPSFHKGLQSIEELCGRRPAVWGRRKYGVGIQVPQLLDKSGYEGALHFVIDDGLYPDEEQGKHRWEGCDGSVVDAVSRIPLAADSASAMLRFSQRMAESMDYDQAAFLVLARWPKLDSPWLEDLHRIEKFAPVLGRFVTFSDFFRTTDTPGRLSRHQAGDYLSPHFVAAVAREEPDPISRYTGHWRRHHRLESVLWTAGITDLLQGRPIDADRAAELELLIDTDCIACEPARQDQQDQILDAAHNAAIQRFSDCVVSGQGKMSGCLFVNSCSYPRKVAVSWPDELPMPDESSSTISLPTGDEKRTVIAEIPPCGFTWLPAGDAAGAASVRSRKRRLPMAEEMTLRNDHFEVRVSEVTGGIAQIKTYRRGPNRLSQQLAFRFPRELTLTVGEDEETRQEKTWYSEMRLVESRIVANGPVRGEIESWGELHDPTDGSVVANYRQAIRVWQSLPVVEIDVEIDPLRMPDGDPWSNYFALRWAWNDPSAALTCSVHEGAQPVTAERFEAPHYVEIADGEQRTTVHLPGLPFHRKTGPRMLDTLLIASGETQRRFRFVISVDDPYPMQRSRSIFHEVKPMVVAEGPEQPLSGWLFHIDARNVQIVRLMPLDAPVSSAVSPTADSPAPDAGKPSANGHLPGAKLRLRETEGRSCTTGLRCFRSPLSARQCDFLGNPITDLEIENDTVQVNLTPFEICDVELRFA